MAHGRLYQIHDTIWATHVMMEERVNGTRRIMHHDRPLDYHVIAARALREVKPSRVQTARRPVTPRPKHPWRKRLLPERGTHAATAITYTGHFYLGEKEDISKWVDSWLALR